MFTMTYDNTESEILKYCYLPNKTEISIDTDAEDINLSILFANFVNMTRIMGYHAGSWENIINDLYGWIVLHVDAADDYDIFQWVYDCSCKDA